jgi:hypothetical protein
MGLQMDGGVGSTGPLDWSDFESENGFEKVLQLATKLVQILIDQSYWPTPRRSMVPRDGAVLNLTSATFKRRSNTESGYYVMYP